MPRIIVSVPMPPAISKTEAALPKDRFPLPSVFKTCPFEPSAVGKTNVVIPDKESADFNVIYCDPFDVPSTKLTPLPVEEVSFFQ